MGLMTAKRAYNWYLSLVAASCMVLYGYDASVFNAVQGSSNWIAWFDTPGLQLTGAINTAYTVGAIFGGFFIGGPVADWAGRKVGMATGAIMVIIATFMQTFSPWHGIGVFIAGRVLIGIGQGVALTAGPIYIGELAPAGIRGKIMSFWHMFFTVGAFLAYWVGYATSRHPELGDWDWKLVCIFQLLMPILIVGLMFTIPGSPRWYIKKSNNIDAARQALRRVRDTEQEVEDEILIIREALEFEKEVISSSYSALWKDRSVRKRLILAFIMNAGQQLTGQGTLNNYSTIIYKKVFKDKSQIALINALNATFGIFYTLNATWTVDRFGRKFLLLVGAAGMAISMLMIATVGSQTPNDADGAKSLPVGIAFTFLLFLFTFFFKPSWGATVWIWTTEIFSMNVRAQAVGMAAQMQNVCNSIFQQFFPTFLASSGFYTFYFFAGINVLLVFFVWFFVPETKNIMLEEMDTLFGGVNHVEKGGDILHIEDAHHANVGGSGGGNTNDEITQYPLPSASGTRNEGEESGIKETKL